MSSSSSKLKQSSVDDLPKKTLPPPLKPCKKCYHNIGGDKTGLCASCDPTYDWSINKNGLLLPTKNENQ